MLHKTSQKIYEPRISLIFFHLIILSQYMTSQQSSPPPPPKGNYFNFFDFFAGGLAGIIAKTLTAPIERVKLLLQTEHQNTKLKTKYNGIIDCFTRCVREEGVISLWRGNGVNVIRYFPTQAINFSAKDFYGRLFQIQTKNESNTQFLLYNLLCGGLAGVTTTCFVHPLDFARTRMAVDLGRSLTQREYKGLWDCLTKVFKSDGIRGLYSGFGVAFISIFIYRGLYFGIYDYGKKSILNPDSSILAKLVFAQASVIIAEQISYPGDTIKRKLFMQACKHTKEYSGMVDCFKKVYSKDGIQGLWKGSYSNILRGIGSSLCLILYDQIKLMGGQKV